MQSAWIIVPASSRMLVCNSLPGLCIHDYSLLHKLGGTSREGSLPGDSRSETSREDNPVLRSILATASNRCEFQVSLSFGGALLVGLAIASIRVTVGLEGVVNIFDHAIEAESAAKFSHREIESKNSS